MWIVVTYDVSTETRQGKTRLRRVAQVCQNYGQRVQKSVFECSVNEMQYEEMKRELLECIDEEEDSLRLYRITEPKGRNVEEYGRSRTVDFDAPLVV